MDAIVAGRELALVIPDGMPEELQLRLREIGRSVALVTNEFVTSAGAQELVAYLARAAQRAKRLAVKGEPKRAPVPPACGPAVAAGRNELCPCGSRAKFKRCCRAKPNRRAMK